MLGNLVFGEEFVWPKIRMRLQVEKELLYNIVLDWHLNILKEEAKERNAGYCFYDDSLKFIRWLVTPQVF